LKVRPFNTQRIIHPIERNDVVNVVRWCIMADLTDGLSIPFQSADPIPVLIISTLLVGWSCCVTLSPSFLLSEYSW
jgi:hypothetical protein